MERNFLMKKLIDGYCRIINHLIVIALALMVILVFTNVVLRYAMNSGISVSEELSRWLFVWLTFLGAIVAMHEHTHLGTDMLVAKLGTRGKKWCLGIGHMLMLFCCILIFKGSWEQVKVNLASTSAAMEASLAIFYSCGLVFSVSAAVVLLYDFYRLVSGQLSENDLLGFRESEEVPH
jgi:TRAP-type transport system small permease protein